MCLDGVRAGGLVEKDKSDQIKAEAGLLGCEEKRLILL